MSGSGGIGGGGPRGNDQVSCETLMTKTILSSPNPEVIPHLKKSQVLDIELRGASLIALTADGEIAGSITSSIMARIVECIRQGFEYVAIVENVSGGRCDVEVRPRSK